MSTRPQPTQKQMIFQQLLLAAAVFLGLQLMCKPPQQAPEKRSSLEILGNVREPLKDAPKTPAEGEAWDLTKGSLVWADSTLKDSTASSINTIYQNKIDE